MDKEKQAEVQVTDASFKLNVSGSTVYSCLRNLIVNDFGINREGFIAECFRSFKVSAEERIDFWLRTQGKMLFEAVSSAWIRNNMTSVLSEAIKKELERLGKLKVSFE